MRGWDWIASHLTDIAAATRDHVVLTIIAVGVGFAISFALALLIHRDRRAYAPVTAVAGLLYTIPSLALFAILVPITGLSVLTAEIGLVSYTLLILVRNIVAGLDAVPPEAREAAAGMGYSALGRLLRVELPLALPVIVAGLRIATVTTIGLVMVTALIGEGGLGQLMLRGFTLQNYTAVYVGTALSVALAVAADLLFLGALRLAPPAGRPGSGPHGARRCAGRRRRRHRPSRPVLRAVALLLPRLRARPRPGPARPRPAGHPAHPHQCLRGRARRGGRSGRGRPRHGPRGAADPRPRGAPGGAAGGHRRRAHGRRPGGGHGHPGRPGRGGWPGALHRRRLRPAGRRHARGRGDPGGPARRGRRARLRPRRAAGRLAGAARSARARARGGAFADGLAAGRSLMSARVASARPRQCRRRLEPRLRRPSSVPGLAGPRRPRAEPPAARGPSMPQRAGTARA